VITDRDGWRRRHVCGECADLHGRRPGRRTLEAVGSETNGAAGNSPRRTVWVRPCVLAMYMLLTQGCLAAGASSGNGRRGREQGPVLVTLEYVVEQRNAKQFLRAINGYGRVRRRDGASRWRVFRDTEHVDVCLENVLVNSRAEQLRQHERSTRDDRHLEDRLQSYARGGSKVRHLIDAQSESIGP
jgi:hypothetical protein